MSAIILILAILSGTIESESTLRADPFLHSYIARLKKDTTPASLMEITAMSEDRLGLLHHGYGTWIRNRWLLGDRDPDLVRFFSGHGIKHPDEMSRILIHALWESLNQALTGDERISVEAKRKVIAARQSAYAQLSKECADKWAASKDAFGACYLGKRIASKDSLDQNPFFGMTVKKDGRVGEVMFFDGTSDEVKQCLRPILDGYHFSPFENDKQLTLYLMQFPKCEVSEQHELQWQNRPIPSTP